jgi:nicotinate-nucleotide adenylyltransferase
VSPQNPLKDSRDTDAYWRRMAHVWQAADAPRMVVSDVERRLGTTFTADTVAALVTRHPEVKFVWLMGADNLLGFHRWRGWEDIMRLLPVAVVARPGDSLRARLGRAATRFPGARLPEHAARALVETPPPAWVYLTAPLHPVSSTALRGA